MFVIGWVFSFQDFNRFQIQIEDGKKVTVNIDGHGHSFHQIIERKLFPKNETIGVWMDREDFRAGGIIKNLVIKAI